MMPSTINTTLRMVVLIIAGFGAAGLAFSVPRRKIR